MPEEQPGTQGQDPQVTPDPTSAVAAAAIAQPATPVPAQGTGPWANDLNALFTDPNTRAAVDGFLREKVQPYTTRLEQETAQAKQAMNLWSSLEKQPIDTYVAITEEMYGPQVAQAVLSSLQQALQSQETQQPATAQPQTQAPATPQYDQRTQQLLEWAETKQIQEFYDSEVSRLKSDPANLDLITTTDKDGNPAIDQIHAFVAMADGDFDKATGLLRDFISRFGVPGQAAPTPPAPVMGSDNATAQSSATPVEPRKQTLDEAINDFMRENRASAAPPVGTV